MGNLSDCDTFFNFKRSILSINFFQHVLLSLYCDITACEYYFIRKSIMCVLDIADIMIISYIGVWRILI